MQSLILVALGFVLLVYSTMHDVRELSGTSNTKKQLKSSNLATNIILYENIVAGYLIKNQLTLRLSATLNSNTVEKITVLDNALINNNVQKTNSYLFDYKSVGFNYVSTVPGMSEYYPNYYMVSSFDKLTPNLKGYTGVDLQVVMGILSSKLSAKSFQGDSVYWSIPWVFEQNSCKITRNYTQLITSSNGYNPYQQFEVFFTNICTQVQAKSSYRFGRYVYLQTITTSSKY